MSCTTIEVEGYHDAGTVSYLLLDPASKQCALIDSVLDYHHQAGRTDTRSAAMWALSQASAQLPADAPEGSHDVVIAGAGAPQQAPYPPVVAP